MNIIVALAAIFLVQSNNYTRSLAQGQGQLFEGSTCRLANGESGQCIVINDCRWALEQIKIKQFPKICQFLGINPVVCCPTVEERKSLVAVGTKSREKCVEYVGPKPLFAPFVIGGKRALAKEYPHMAILGFGSEKDIQWQCGGSLISELFVLTAAHCIFSRELGQVKWIRLGDLDIKNETDDSFPQDLTVARTIIHPDYDYPSHYNDIALIQLNQTASFNSYVTPACLFVQPQLPRGELIATGWGKTDYLGELSSHLMEVSLVEVEHDQCKKQYREVTNRLPRGILEESQVCAGSADPKLARDTCQGDSGGPLQVAEQSWKQYFSIVGITSFGKYCGTLNGAGVYTRVSHFIPWIEAIVWPET